MSGMDAERCEGELKMKCFLVWKDEVNMYLVKLNNEPFVNVQQVA